MLILPKKKSTYQKWYEKHKERISAKRKKLYAENPEYREQRIEASRRYRSGERTPPAPPVSDGRISFQQAANRLGKGDSTLRGWRRKKYFPEPKLHNRAPWFTENQVILLGKLKECIEKYGKRRGPIKQSQLKEVQAFIAAHWN
jgi:hypothetical protein